jgi:hypothetical protein
VIAAWRREWGHVSGDRGGAGDALDHAVDVAPVDGGASEGSQDQWSAGPFASAGFEDS